MGDQQYIKLAKRRRRWMLLGGLLVLLTICGGFVVRNVFYDRCTTSFERGQDAVISSYIAALASANLVRAQDCWERAAYYNPESGCSEMCLEKVLGADMTLAGVETLPPVEAEGRDRRAYTVNVRCSDGSQHSGRLLLDAPAGSLPWKHWRVLESDVGGSINQLWCGG